MVSYQICTKGASLSNKGITSLVRYFILIPLLAPKGLNALVPGYKAVVTAWSMAALAVILIGSFLRLRDSKRIVAPPLGFVIYFAVAVVVTAFSVDGIVSGLQELFLFPAIFLYLIGLDESEFREYVVACAHILCFLFFAHLIAPASLFAASYHMTFLGHVQVISQYGLLGLVLSGFILLKKWASRVLAFVLAALSLTCMLTADTDSAHLCLVVFGLVLILMWFVPLLDRLDFRYVVILSIVFSCLVVKLTIMRQSPLIGTGLDWTFNGRLFVWESADELIRQAPLFGYGVENSVISTFWSAGMSYAHNQVVQSLLDGGAVLLVAMVWLLCSVACCVNRIKDKPLRCIAASGLCSLLFVMIFDSFTLYCYAFILLAFVSREGLFFEEKGQAMGFSAIKQKFARFYYAQKIKRVAAVCEGRVYTGGKSYVTPYTYLSDNVNFNGMAMSGKGRISVGANFHSGPGCQIITSFHDYDRDDAIPYGDHMIDKDVTIGDNVWLGNNVIILGGVTIGEGAIIQAGSVVCKSVPAYSIAGGHPAVPFKQRDIGHYEELKRLGRFH